MDNDFESKINSSNKPFLIELYDPWCSHCRAFRPKWEELVNTSRFRNRIIFEDINCYNNKKFCSKYSENGYPQLLYFDEKTKQYVEYTGTMSFDYIESFIERQLNFPLLFLNNETEIDKYLELTNSSSLFLIYYEDDNDLLMAQNISLQYRSHNTYFFAIKYPKHALIVYRSIYKKITFEKDWDFDSINNFVRDNVDPVLPPLPSDVFDKMEEIIVVFINSSAQYFDALEIADKTRTNLTFYYSLTSDDQLLSNFIGINIEKLPRFVIINIKNKKWCFVPFGFSSNFIRKWIEDFDPKKYKWKGPGNGILSPIYSVFYQGGLFSYILAGCFLIILFLIFFFIYDLYKVNSNTILKID